MLQHRKIWIFLFTLLLLVVLVIALSKQDRTFNKVELSYDNHVTNYTKYTYVDTIVYVGLDSIGMCDMTVEVKRLTEEAKANFGTGIELKGMIYGAGHHYTLWLDDASREEHIVTVAHELIHLRQYYSKQLIYDGFYVYWNRAKYDLKETDYYTRPWEADAFEHEVGLSRKIRSALY